LKNLKELNLAYNNISVLNDDFDNLEKLSVLSLEGNILASSDDVLKGNLFTLSKLTHLKNLNLSNNKIHRILLEEIFNIFNSKLDGSEHLLFNSLSDIDLSNNQLQSIPDLLELR